MQALPGPVVDVSADAGKLRRKPRRKRKQLYVRQALGSEMHIFQKFKKLTWSVKFAQMTREKTVTLRQSLNFILIGLGLEYGSG